MTSNVATDLVMKLCADPARPPDPDELIGRCGPRSCAAFKPAFLGRAIVVPYYPIGDEAMRRIIELQLAGSAPAPGEQPGAVHLRRRPRRRDRPAVHRGRVGGAQRGPHPDPDPAARDLPEYLSRMAAEASIARVHVSVDDGGRFGYQID